MIPLRTFQIDESKHHPSETLLGKESQIHGTSELQITPMGNYFPEQTRGDAVPSQSRWGWFHDGPSVHVHDKQGTPYEAYHEMTAFLHGRGAN